MSTPDIHPFTPRADQFGRSVAARLSAGSSELPYDVTERLRAARVRALERRKRVASAHAPASSPAAVVLGAGAVALGGGPDASWWNRIASVLPLLVLAAGLVLIHSVQTDERARELADVDAALLTDDLPPAAYADPGFVQFLKSGWE